MRRGILLTREVKMKQKEEFIPFEACERIYIRRVHVTRQEQWR